MAHPAHVSLFGARLSNLSLLRSSALNSDMKLRYKLLRGLIKDKQASSRKRPATPPVAPSGI